MYKKAITDIGIGTASLGPCSDLKKLAESITKEEKARQDRAEKYVLLDVNNAHVVISGKPVPVPQEGPTVLIAGSDDQLIKEFIEGQLNALERVLIEEKAQRAWTATKVVTAVRGPAIPAFRLTRMGNIILNCCRAYQERWATVYACHVFRPSVTVILRAMRRYASRVNLAAIGVKSVFDSFELARLLDLVSRFIRRIFSHWGYINANRKYEIQAESNFDSARNLVLHLAEQHSRLLILRIDLYYKPYYDIVRADWHVENFLRWLRSRKCRRELLPGYLGFIIKRENGIVRGMHWHLMVICDGNIQRNDGYLSQALGEMWARRTGQGPGSYYNCYSDRSKYPFDGLGLLDLSDWSKMIGLRYVLYYLSKQDCVLKVSGSKERSFWRTPTSKLNMKRGRPRSDKDSLKLIRRVLGGKRSKYPKGFGLDT